MAGFIFLHSVSTGASTKSLGPSLKGRPFMQKPPVPLQEGLVFGGRYHLSECLAQTHMSEIWKGEDLTKDREIVLKFANPGQLKFLKNEREVLSLLNGTSRSYFTNLHEYIVSNGREFIAIEYIDGITLHDLLKREERMPLYRVIEIVMQLCQALSILRKHGIIHRDIKPANIIIGSRARLVDFGLACKTGHQEHNMQGTPSYMSPEQVKSHELDSRLDIYSLGLVFHKMITKKNPMQSEAFSLTNTLKARLETAKNQVNKFMPPLDQNEIEGRISPNRKKRLKHEIRHLHSLLQEIILKMTEKDPGKRYQGIEKMRSQLRMAHRIAKRLAPYESLSAKNPKKLKFLRIPFDK